MRILNKIPKSHNARHGKGGFTLVELCVVLALLAILTVTISSFSVLMNRYAVEASRETDFWEDNAAIKAELRRWIAENDTPLNTFAVQDGTLVVKLRETQEVTNTISFAGGVLTVDGAQKEGFAAVDGIDFTTNNNGRLIKCTVYRMTEGGERKEVSFLFSTRSASIAPTTQGEVSENG